MALSVCSVHLFVQSKLNLGSKFWTKRDWAFILGMCISCGKTFLLVPKILTLWYWPWLLTYFWKNLTLAITFEPKEIGLYGRHGYSLWKDLSVCTKVFYPMTLTFNFDLPLKKFKLFISIVTERDGAFILSMDIPCGNTFLSIHCTKHFYPWTSNFDQILKKKS